MSSYIIAECDNVNDFTYIYSCTSQLDTSNKLYGNASIKLTKNGDFSGYFVFDIDGNIDLSVYDSIKFNFYSADRSNIATISINIFTTSGKVYTDCFQYFIGWQIVNGWNTFDIDFDDFTQYGSGGLDYVTSIRFVINLTTDNQTEQINWDRIEVISPNANIEPEIVNCELVINQPGISSGSNITSHISNCSIDINVPEISGQQNVSIEPEIVNCEFVINQPGISSGSNITSPISNCSIDINVPEISGQQNVSIEPEIVNCELVINQPGISSGSNITSPISNCSIDINVPEISGKQNVSIEPGMVNCELVINQPGISSGSNITSPISNCRIDIIAPKLSIEVKNINCQIAEAVIVAYNPIIEVLAKNIDKSFIAEAKNKNFVAEAKKKSFTSEVKNKNF